MGMSEEEYMQGEPHDDDEITYEFLIDEPDDLDFLMLPKLDINPNEVIERYYKRIKQCRNKDMIVNVLNEMYLYIDTMTTLRNDIKYLQDRAKELEFNVMMLNQMS